MRYHYLLHSFFAFLLLCSGLRCAPPELPLPNIVWITAEDMSPVLGYLGDSYAITPHLDALSRESVIYTHAFATAPVCSPSRAALINGIMASVQGAHQMRSAYALPASWEGFPAVLRRNGGYYTTNNVKTDYNSGNASAIIAASLDENSDSADWTGREKGQPFFSIFNLMVTHQSRSMVWPYEQFVEQVQSQLTPDEIHDPALATVPPYYPDTPIVRKTIARFYDCVTVMDKQVGALLDRLKEEGLWEDTIVFFYSDHGTGLPRHKRTALDSGMHVPLMVRFPEKYRHLAPAEPGERLDRLVSFEDFGPTVLSLAGLEVPDYMQGVPFLGASNGPERRYVFGHRDRVDEAMDMVRTVRDNRYLYVRNYMPHLSYNQPVAYPDLGEIRDAFYEMAAGEYMSPPQVHFAGPTKEREELYDTENDPLNLENLADDASFQDVLLRMRRVHKDSLISRRDLGFMPEIEMARASAGTTPYDWALTDAYPIEDLIGAAELVGIADTLALARNFAHPNPGVRYWAAMGLGALPILSVNAQLLLEAALEDVSPAVQIEAATALLTHRPHRPALDLLVDLLSNEDLNIVMYAARAIQMTSFHTEPATPAMEALFQQYGSDTTDPGMFIGFAAKGYLETINQ